MDMLFAGTISLAVGRNGPQGEIAYHNNTTELGPDYLIDILKETPTPLPIPHLVVRSAKTPVLALLLFDQGLWLTAAIFPPW